MIGMHLNKHTSIITFYFYNFNKGCLEKNVKHGDQKSIPWLKKNCQVNLYCLILKLK
jgi:hypothetical protein